MKELEADKKQNQDCDVRHRARITDAQKKHAEELKKLEQSLKEKQGKKNKKDEYEKDEVKSSQASATIKSNSLEQIYSKFAESSNLPSRMHCPRIVKVCLNVGLGKARYEEKFLESTLRDLSLIAGQKAVVTYAKKSIASFKLRQGFPVGCRVTLRRSKKQLK